MVLGVNNALTGSLRLVNKTAKTNNPATKNRYAVIVILSITSKHIFKNNGNTPHNTAVIAANTKP